MPYGHFKPGSNPDYHELLTQPRGPLVLLASMTQDAWQGDDLWFVRLDDQYGFLLIGWGSCSGCDAYHAAGDRPERLAELRAQLMGEVVWFDSIRELLDWYAARDWDAVTHIRKDDDGLDQFRRMIEEVEEVPRG